MLRTIQKIGPVLDLFTAQQPDWGVTQVADALGVPRSTAHSVLSSLVETGLLQCRGRGRYRLGWRIIELSEALRASIDIRTVAHPVLRRLAEHHGETVHLAVLEYDRVLYIEKVQGTRQLNVAGVRVGARLEPHCSAVGKMLLAHRTPEEIRKLLTVLPLRRLTAATITRTTDLTDELTKIRSAGMAFDEGEAVAEVSCVAAPIRDDLGAVVAAMSLTVPATRFSPGRAELTHAVVAASKEITHLLAGGPLPRLAVLRDDPSESPAAERTRLRAVSSA